MAETAGSLQPNPTYESLLAALDPYSQILSHCSYSLQQNALQTTFDPYFLERGPRYNVYAHLREYRLRVKRLKHEQDFQIPESELTPPAKKKVQFEGSFSASKRSRSSVLTKSVPDFSSALRKENRKPTAVTTPPLSSTMPPPAMSKGSKVYGLATKLGGSKSANSAEKKNVAMMMMMGRKSYASMEELKGSAAVGAYAAAGENRGGGSSGRAVGGWTATVLGCRAS